MKAKQNLRVILVTILAILMVSFAFFAVACNNSNNNDSSSMDGFGSTGGEASTDGETSTGGGETSTGGTTTSTGGGTTSINPGTSSSQGGGTSSGGGTTTDDGTKPNTTIGATDTLTVPEGYKEVKATLNLQEYAAEVGKVAEDKVKGVFTIQVGAEIRSRTKEWNGMVSYTKYEYLNLHKTLDGNTSLGKEALTYSMKLAKEQGLKVNVPGDGYLCLYIQNGSSGVAEQTITVNGTPYTFPGTTNSNPVVQFCIDVTKGEYVIARPSGTVDVFMAELHCVAVDSKPTGIAVSSNPQLEFIAGQEFSTDGLVVGMNYEDGTQEALEATQYTVDSTAVDMTKPGNYNVNITYTEKPEFTCAYTVNVNELKEIAVGTYATEKVANSSAGNGVYYNQSVKTVYAVNEELNTKYLTVNAYDTNNNLYLFKNDNAAVTYTNVDGTPFTTATAGNYTVLVTLTLNGVAKTGTYNVAVVDAALAVTNNAVNVYVDGNYVGANGAVATPTGLEVACNQFKTIGMALEYLNGKKTELGTMPVTMHIAAGTYNEKLEVEVANLTMVGLGATSDATLIEWDSLYGVDDASGYAQVTDSTQTVAVRETAVNCTMKNLTISNYWNSVARFNERADKDSCDHRALALLVQSDKFVMDNCRLLGYQDTVQFFKGRQLVKNSFIAGTTDFIFGTNGTTYFYKCEIKSTKHVKGSAGYITAMKGCSKGAEDYVTYGIIFDQCNFTAEEGVLTSIGRCWGAYAAVAVINSNLGAHILKFPSTGASSGERYVSMSAKPTDATVKFVEYNNTGDGAITATQAGMTYLDEATAKNYSDFAVIFGKTNGKVTYADAWNPTL